MAKRGFEVTKKFHLDTAWQATFSHGTGGRTIGINSEVMQDVYEITCKVIDNWSRWML